MIWKDIRSKFGEIDERLIFTKCTDIRRLTVHINYLTKISSYNCMHPMKKNERKLINFILINNNNNNNNSNIIIMVNYYYLIILILF